MFEVSTVSLVVARKISDKMELFKAAIKLCRAEISTFKEVLTAARFELRVEKIPARVEMFEVSTVSLVVARKISETTELFKAVIELCRAKISAVKLLFTAKIAPDKVAFIDSKELTMLLLKAEIELCRAAISATILEVNVLLIFDINKESEVFIATMTLLHKAAFAVRLASKVFSAVVARETSDMINELVRDTIAATFIFVILACASMAAFILYNIYRRSRRRRTNQKKGRVQKRISRKKKKFKTLNTFFIYYLV